MSIWVNEGGTHYELSEVWVNEGGTHYELNEVWSNENGTHHQIHSAWKPPDTLTWTSSGTVNATNNGYNCTITRSEITTGGQRFDFTLKEPTRFKIILDSYEDPSNIIHYLLLDGRKVTITTRPELYIVDVTDSGSHYIDITTFGNPVTFSITAEKI